VSPEIAAVMGQPIGPSVSRGLRGVMRITSQTNSAVYSLRPPMVRGWSLTTENRGIA